MRILAIAAHPDDVEWQCGGTLALCKERGDEIIIAVATNGNVGTGDPLVTREMIAATRHEEAKASAALCPPRIELRPPPECKDLNSCATMLSKSAPRSIIFNCFNP